MNKMMRPDYEWKMHHFFEKKKNTYMELFEIEIFLEL